MSQILESKIRTEIYQDLIFPKKKSVLETFAVEASCYVCNKGLQDGYSVTAKHTHSGTLLYCDKHYPMN